MVFRGWIGYIIGMSSFSKNRLLAALATVLALTCTPAQAQVAVGDYDDKAAAIFAYFAVGKDDSPAASVTAEQFAAHIAEITDGPYTVLPLPEIVAAFKGGKTLPPRTLGLSFDGADISILKTAAPILIANNLPFTVFIPAGKVAEGQPPSLSWADLRQLQRSKLVTFGLHPANYARMGALPTSEIRRQINNALTRIRDELEIEPELFAYPFGEYSKSYKAAVKEMGFSAAFGQQSGIASAGDDLFALPRFTLTEPFADMDRFRMTANALPLPVADVSPADPLLHTLTPAIGFTLPEGLGKAKGLTCFSSGDEKPELELLGSRVEIRTAPVDENRVRLNCTIPAARRLGEDMRWRWFGMMFTTSPDLAEKIEPGEEPAQGEDQTASGGFISHE